MKYILLIVAISLIAWAGNDMRAKLFIGSADVVNRKDGTITYSVIAIKSSNRTRAEQLFKMYLKKYIPGKIDEGSYMLQEIEDHEILDETWFR